MRVDPLVSWVMEKTLIAVLLAFLAACSSTPSKPDAPASAAPKDDVQVLTTYPTTEYENLGIGEFVFSRSGLRAPSVADVLPELKMKVKAAGGNAFIIRHRIADTRDTRSLQVSAEILNVK